MTTDETIFHIAMPDDWDAARHAGEYTMSSRGRHLDDEGFIHASTRAQTEATANRFYADVDELVLLEIDAAKVASDLRWEPASPGSDELFPHIYGALPVGAVVRTHPWIPATTAEGRPTWSLDSLSA